MLREFSDQRPRRSSNKGKRGGGAAPFNAAPSRSLSEIDKNHDEDDHQQCRRPSCSRLSGQDRGHARHQAFHELTVVVVVLVAFPHVFHGFPLPARKPLLAGLSFLRTSRWWQANAATTCVMLDHPRLKGFLVPVTASAIVYVSLARTPRTRSALHWKLPMDDYPCTGLGVGSIRKALHGAVGRSTTSSDLENGEGLQQ